MPAGQARPPYSWGDDMNSSHANYNFNISQTTDVGQYAANPWGFFDMHGNVWEWVTTGRRIILPVPRPIPRVRLRARIGSFRGGCFRNNSILLRSAKRGDAKIDHRYYLTWLPRSTQSRPAGHGESRNYSCRIHSPNSLPRPALRRPRR